jgi:hypothetical protein
LATIVYVRSLRCGVCRIMMHSVGEPVILLDRRTNYRLSLALKTNGLLLAFHRCQQGEWTRRFPFRCSKKLHPFQVCVECIPANLRATGSALQYNSRIGDVRPLRALNGFVSESPLLRCPSTCGDSAARVFSSYFSPWMLLHPRTGPVPTDGQVWPVESC